MEQQWKDEDAASTLRKMSDRAPHLARMGRSKDSLTEMEEFAEKLAWAFRPIHARTVGVERRLDLVADVVEQVEHLFDFFQQRSIFQQIHNDEAEPIRWCIEQQDWKLAQRLDGIAMRMFGEIAPDGPQYKAHELALSRLEKQREIWQPLVGL